MGAGRSSIVVERVALPDGRPRPWTAADCTIDPRVRYRFFFDVAGAPTPNGSIQTQCNNLERGTPNRLDWGFCRPLIGSGYERHRIAGPRPRRGCSRALETVHFLWYRSVVIRVILVCVVLCTGGTLATEEPPNRETPVTRPSQELPDPECLKAIRQARIAIRLGGSNSFETAVEPCGGRFEVLHEGLSLARTRDDQEAERRLLESLVGRIETNPESVPLVAAERAILDSSLGQVELRALCDHLAAAAVRPDAGPEIWRAYAVAAGRIGDFEAARAAIDKILAISPSPEVRWAAVDLDQRLERWPDLVSQLERLAAEDEVMARIANLQLVEAYARVGRLADAISTAESLMSADEVDAGELASDHWTLDALFAGAWALYDAGEFELAKTALEEVLALDPDREDVQTAVQLLYGPIEARREHSQQAERRLAQDGDPEALFEEGTQRLAVGDSAGAIELLRQAAAAMPENEVAWSNFGVAALRLERWGEAATAFEHAVGLGNNDPSTRLNLGTAWVRSDQCEKGMGVLDRLVSEHPELWQAQYWRWSCLSRAGRKEEAASALKAYQSGRKGAATDS